MSHTLGHERQQEMAVTFLRCGRAAVGWVCGAVDPATAAQLRTELVSVVESGIDHLIVDLSSVTHFCPDGTRALLDLRELLEPHGALTLQRPSPSVLEFLDLSATGSLMSGITSDREVQLSSDRCITMEPRW